MRYRVVIIPASCNLLSSTYQLLSRFVAAGGIVVALTPVPHLLDGAPADLDDLFGGRCVVVHSLSELTNRLEGWEEDGRLCRLARLPTSTINAPIYSIERTTEEGDIIFLANMGDTPHLQAEVLLQGEGQVERWDLVDGSVEVLPSQKTSRGLVVTLDFAETESHLLFLRRRPGGSSGAVEGAGEGAGAKAGSESGTENETGNMIWTETNTRAKEGPLSRKPICSGRHLPQQRQKEKVLSSTWQFQPENENVLVLDTVRYRIGMEAFSPPTAVSEMAAKIREHYKVPVVPIRDRQPWRKYQEGGGKPPLYADLIELQYEVESSLDEPADPADSADPAGHQDLQLVVEDAHEFRIEVNGIEIKSRLAEAGAGAGEGERDFCWLDPAFKRLPVAGAWRKGKNDIRLFCRFHEDLPLETLYLLGRFSVVRAGRARYRLEPPRHYLTGGSWVEQGYPFYAGRANYIQEIYLSPEEAAGRVWLELSDLPNVTKVFCNDEEAGLIAWRPYLVDLSGLLRPGANVIRLQVANSLHNVLGPIHNAGNPVIIGPQHYMKYRNAGWQDEYRLVPDGLARTVRLVWEK